MLTIYINEEVIKVNKNKTNNYEWRTKPINQKLRVNKLRKESSHIGRGRVSIALNPRRRMPR